MIMNVFMPRFFSRAVVFAVLSLSLVGLSACDGLSNTLKAERDGGYEIQDYRDVLASRVESEEQKEDASSAALIPSLQPFVAQSSKSMRAMPLVSISVNQSVPIRDVLFELAEQADYDLELDPNISGSVIFTARERPFDEVIERLSVIAGLRYKMDDDFLRVELDTPYNRIHKIDYLSYIRSSSGSIRNDIAVVTGDGADTGSDFEASSEASIDFWAELDANIQQILAAQRVLLRTDSDPVITAVPQAPDVAAVSPQGADGSVQPPNAVLQVQSLPTNVGGGAVPADPSQYTYSINKQAGLVNIYAPEAAQREIAEYLRLLRRSVTAQVLVEAKILQVSLSDQYTTGIDWATIADTNRVFGEDIRNQWGFISQNGNSQLTSLSGSSLIEPASSNFIAGFISGDIGAYVEALSQFGTVKALASPRMTVLNNQPAVLNVATNEVFFDINIEREDDGDALTTDPVTVETEIRNVPVGVLINVQPSINLDSKKVSMAVRPTITAIATSVQNPAVIFAAEDAGITDIATTFGDTTEVPELNVQEIDTVIEINSGQAVVLGGLLNDRISSDETGVPLLSEVPLFGSLFKNHSDTVSKVELVIFLKATILEDPADTVHNTDRDLYRAFSGDRRPFKL